ncbi:MAG: SDR family oxidoreductase [Proteobacteria bacterium]|nr:SDR family oxidoreductase [Pseudomonadota bacterium]
MDARIAVVTGAGSGIGRAVTVRLVGLGYEVVAIGRRRERLQETVETLGNQGDRIRIAAVDVGDSLALRRSLEGIGTVHALVANAGICRQAKLEDPDSDQVWNEVLTTNLDGVWHTFRSIGPSLCSSGRAVVVSSGLGKLGRAGYSAYTASKHAVLGLVKCLAMEMAHKRITVNAVCPGWVQTEMAKSDLVRTAEETGQSVQDVREAVFQGIPLRRFVEADEVAALICWLLSEDAAAVTGQAYNISSGEFFA